MIPGYHDILECWTLLRRKNVFCRENILNLEFRVSGSFSISCVQSSILNSGKYPIKWISKSGVLNFFNSKVNART